MEPLPQLFQDSASSWSLMEVLADEINCFNKRWLEIAEHFKGPRSVYLIDRSLLNPQRMKKPDLDVRQSRNAWGSSWQIHSTSSRPRWEPPVLDYSDYITESREMYKLLQQRTCRTESIEECVEFEDALIETDLMHRYFTWVHDQRIGSAEAGNKENEDFYERLELELVPDQIESGVKSVTELLKTATRNLTDPYPLWVGNALKSPLILEEPVRREFLKDCRRISKKMARLNILAGEIIIAMMENENSPRRIMARFDILGGETLIAGLENKYSPRQTRIDPPKPTSVKTRSKESESHLPASSGAVASTSSVQQRRPHALGTEAALVFETQLVAIEAIYRKIQTQRTTVCKLLITVCKLLGLLSQRIAFSVDVEGGMSEETCASIIEFAELKVGLHDFQWLLHKKLIEANQRVKREQSRRLEEMASQMKMNKENEAEIVNMKAEVKLLLDETSQQQRLVTECGWGLKQHMEEWSEAVSKFEEAQWMDAHEDADSESAEEISIAPTTEYQTAGENDPDNLSSVPIESNSSQDGKHTVPPRNKTNLVPQNQRKHSVVEG